jgi:hypothetical protein
MLSVNYMLFGAIAMTSIVVGFQFLRFWRKSADRFFLFFAMSFLLEGFNRIAMGTFSGLNESAPEYYLVRLVAFALILVAILDKNFPRNKDL